MRKYLSWNFLFFLICLVVIFFSLRIHSIDPRLQQIEDRIIDLQSKTIEREKELLHLENQNLRLDSILDLFIERMKFDSVIVSSSSDSSETKLVDLRKVEITSHRQLIEADSFLSKKDIFPRVIKADSSLRDYNLSKKDKRDLGLNYDIIGFYSDKDRENIKVESILFYRLNGITTFYVRNGISFFFDRDISLQFKVEKGNLVDFRRGLKSFRIQAVNNKGKRKAVKLKQFTIYVEKRNQLWNLKKPSRFFEYEPRPNDTFVIRFQIEKSPENLEIMASEIIDFHITSVKGGELKFKINNAEFYRNRNP